MSELRKILISLPDSLLKEVDDFISQQKVNRSEFVREAMALYIREKRRIEIRERLKKGYIEMGEINLSIACMCIGADSVQQFSYEEKLSECE